MDASPLLQQDQQAQVAAEREHAKRDLLSDAQKAEGTLLQARLTFFSLYTIIGWEVHQATWTCCQSRLPLR